MSNSRHSIQQLFFTRLAKYPLETKHLELFANYLEHEATEVELLRLNLRKLAHRTGLDLAIGLDIAVLAVLEGILELQWTVFCPTCLAELDTFHNLQSVYLHDQTCIFCKTVVSPDANRTFNAVFSVNPTVLALDLLPLMVYKPDGSKFTDESEMLSLLTPEQLNLVIEVEKLAREYPPITAIELLHNQFFHQFFKSQNLPINVSLKISRVCLLFTDLRGSTALYNTLGDAKAYELVRNHFELLTEQTYQYNGIVVKTMGDAIMAAFAKEEDALKAALNYHLALKRFNQQNQLVAGQNELLLKIGLSAGACLTVNQNDILDYFGTTVNLVARLQELSQSNDIITTKDFITSVAPTCLETLLTEFNYHIEEQGQLNLRGLPKPINVLRLALSNR